MIIFNTFGYTEPNEIQRELMKRSIRLFVVSVAAVLVLMPMASGQDVVRVAGAQHGVWESAAVELGQWGGVFKRNGIELKLLNLDDVKEIIQSVVVGGADIGLAVGTISVIQAYVFGAPIRVIGASMAGSPNYWYVLKSSPIRTLEDLAGKTVGYERNGSSSQYDAIDLTRKLRPRARLVATGGAAATLELLNAGNIDAGWATPPFGIEKIERGAIRVVARANDNPQIRNKTVGVIIAHADALQQPARMS